MDRFTIKQIIRKRPKKKPPVKKRTRGGISKHAYSAFGFGPSVGGILLGGIVDKPK